ncbi:SNF5-domain-containing protein [Auriscalpium vulgare]|uniref:SNF5-domain-containing protein n=1 Tax=Auriscalpium vulgare TaxID=40419 RepID=A0ACB8R564_9AGAM|nr:SNF5-domain-containing protein [Auriscalpium vulgare]
MRCRRDCCRPPKVRSEDANRPEVLVPIRLEFDVEHHKMRDTFVWNLNGACAPFSGMYLGRRSRDDSLIGADTVITPDVFAQSIVDDYALAPSYLSVISKAIQDQLSDYKAHMAAGEDEESVTHGRLAPEEEQWWEGWRKRNEADALAAAKKDRPSRKRRKVNKGSEVKPAPYGADGEDKGMVADVEMDDTDALEEMRILVKLDIVVGSVKLEDQFEWDIDNPGASPEQFAEVYAQDLGLGGEFKTGIAHSIREQVQTYQKSLFLVGHPSDGTMVQDDDLRMSFLPSLTSAARSMDQITSFTPTLAYLSDSELERTDKEREKEMNRRRKRNTRGRRGIALPDREPIKTARTPAIGFPDVDPATLALAAAAAAPTSRRAAAAAASLTIANMVASENGTALITPTMPMAVPTAPTPVVPKEKKTKGLFKPPSYPSSVLRPRAHVHAPTMSTAADASTLPPPLENDPPAPTPVTAPNSTITKVISAKRAKELEREAKEKEFADGQHANMINGVWHCSNCGCPEDIAIGRRKGPLGDKSQCGTCGKYWHRHRRPMPVVYNSDPEFHLNLRAEAERAKTYAKKKGGAAALRAANAAAAEQEPPTPAFVEPETPTRSKAAAWSETPRRTPSRGRAHAEDDRQVSPVSSGSSSASEPIVSQKMKVNGVNHAKAEALQNDAASTKSPSFAAASAAVPAGDGLMSPSQHTEELPPEWLREHRAAAQREYPNDRFEVLSRLGPTGEQEWRLKCLDCPGKLYKPGDRNLSNFEVHLKNRNHRARVNDRLRREAASHGDSS